MRRFSCEGRAPLLDSSQDPDGTYYIGAKELGLALLSRHILVDQLGQVRTARFDEVRTPPDQVGVHLVQGAGLLG